MTALDFLTPQCLFIELRQSSLKALNGDDSLELPLERLTNKQLTNACRETLTLRLRNFLKKHSA